MSTAERTPTKSAPWGEHTVLAALREKFPMPEYAFIAGVADSTGFSSRRADAIVMSCWPSRGLHLMGIEVKSSRSDWTRELKNPAKAERICRYCDRWYVATGAPGIVEDGELPPTWGLLEPRGLKMVITKEASVALQPEPISRGFLAALLRQGVDASVGERAIEERIRRAKDVAREEGRQRGAKEQQQATCVIQGELTQLRGRLEQFEKASGIKIDQWSDGRRIGRAVALVMKGDYFDRAANEIDGMECLAQRILESVRQWKEERAKLAIASRSGEA